MEIQLEKAKTGYLEEICSFEQQREDSFESSLAELMPDISQVLTADGTALLKTKNPEPGACVLGGVLELCLTYSTAEGETMSHELTVPLNYRMEHQSIDPSSLVMGDLRVLSVEARPVNARKLVFKIQSCCRIHCFRKEELELCSGPAAEGYQVRRETLRLPLIQLVDERGFDLSQSFSLDGPAAAELLSWSLSLRDIQNTWSEGRLTFTGKLCLSLLYRPREGTLPIYLSREEPFTQTVEGVGEALPEVSFCMLTPTSAYVTCEPGLSGDGKSIGYDVSFVLQYCVSEMMELPYASDLYSTKSKVCVKLDSQLLPFPGEETVMSDTVEASVKLEGVSRFLDCSCAAAPMSPARERDGRFRGAIYMNLTYQGEDGLVREKRMTVPTESPSFSLRPKAVTAAPGECVLAPAAGGCGVRIPLRFVGVSGDVMRLDSLAAAEESPLPSDTAGTSLWLCRFGPEDSLWDLGKKYGVAVDAIREASDLGQEQQPAPGQLLLIPAF